MEKRSVTSGYHGSKISGSQQPFLTEAAICIFERWKKSMGYCFVPECNHAQENNKCYFPFIFSAIFAWPRLVEIQKFATVATCRKDFSYLIDNYGGTCILHG